MRRLGAAAGAAALILAGGGPATGSGYYGPMTYTVARDGGTPAERARIYAGRPGIVLATSPAPLLYLEWRLLNGLEVDPEVGETLARPCCDAPLPEDDDHGSDGWVKAARAIGGEEAAPAFIATDMPGPDYTSVPNCFPDAFDTATATLRDRAARFGAKSPDVLAWLRTQAAVFDACANPKAALPAQVGGAPVWLRADRAYQEAAFALYQGRNDEAARRFAEIATDAGSPWRPKALYLTARAVQRQALADATPQSFAAARAAIDRLAAAPAGTYGQGEVRDMRRTLDYRDRPEQLLAELSDELHQRRPAPDLAVSLRDYLSLGARHPEQADIVDWMATMTSEKREEALAHASERWTATGKECWLVAALSLARPGDAAAASLAEDAARVSRASPAWLTAQYHEMRLGLAKADAAALRGRIEAILAGSLAESDRNIFLSLRTQLSTDRSDFLRYALRVPYCVEGGDFCMADSWAAEDDGGLALDRASGRWVAFGADAEAILDRMTLAERMAAARDARLPAPLRLDLTLTNYGRAVQLQDRVAIDRNAADLARMLPQMRSDWLAIVGRPPGPARRFAELFVLAKIPGVSPDLNGYTRPTGTVAHFQGRWPEWMILPRGVAAPAADFPELREYNQESWWTPGRDDEESRGDLACFTKCGAGGLVFRLPGFVAAGTARALAERASFVFRDDAEALGEAAAPLPKGAVSAWEALYAYARAHPSDPRTPEALYWLVRISRFGQHHDRIGYRAFRLLHTRHATSQWTRRTPYYYD